MFDKLVSLLTPCYNTASYLPRLLDAVLRQTYPRIEMIVVDDGSTDHTAELIASYARSFEAKGYLLLYEHQENQGQSVAINRGLKLVHGDYLAWPDADDYYADESAIEKMVKALEETDASFRMVRTQEMLVSDPDLKPLSVVGEGRPYEEPTSLFEECLLHLNDFYFYPGAYMVDVAALRAETDMEIYTDRDGGQNWQIMLPMLYRFRCLTIPEPLYHVVVRESSHSRGAYSGLDREILKNDAYQRVATETLRRIKGMDLKTRETYEDRLREKYDLVRLEIALRYRDQQATRKALSDIQKDHVKLPLGLRCVSSLVAHPLGNKIYSIIKG